VQLRVWIAGAGETDAPTDEAVAGQDACTGGSPWPPAVLFGTRFPDEPFLFVSIRVHSWLRLFLKVYS
jgi:hypothetical protein